MSSSVWYGGGATRRERAALMVLPAFVIAAAYVLVVRPNAQRTLESTRARLAAERTQAPNPAAAASDVSFELELRDRLAELRQQFAARSRPPATSGARSVDGHRVARTLAEHRVTLLEERVEGSGADDSTVFEARRWLSTSEHADRGPLRTLRVRGAYFDLLEALRALLEPDVDAVLLRVDMNQIPWSEDEPTWTLIIA